MVIYMNKAQGQEQTIHWSPKIFVSIIIQSIKLFSANSLPLNDILTVSSHSNEQATKFDLAVKWVMVNQGSSFI